MLFLLRKLYPNTDDKIVYVFPVPVGDSNNMYLSSLFKESIILETEFS